MRRVWSWLAATTIVVAYNLWLLFPLVDGGRILRTGLVSELAADTRPWHNLFRVGDAVAALTWIVVALLGARRWTMTWHPRLAATMAILAGIGVLGDAVFNLDCSATMDAGCVATGNLAVQSLDQQLHAAMSVLYTVAHLAGVAVMAWTTRGVWRRAAIAVFVVVAPANVLLSVTDLLGRPQQTWVQCVSVVVTSLWFAALAIEAGRPQRQR